MYRILLADDEQIVIDSLTFIIERNFPGQVEFLSARSGGDAIELCQANKVDIAFMDVSMPGLNGIEAIKAIKASSPAVIFIVLTAFDRFEYAQQAVNLGVYEYLSKPVNRNKIVEVARSAMSQVDVLRRKQLSEIQIREKLDSVVNIVESDFIYSLIFPSEKAGDIASYLDFFGIKDPSFYFMTIEVSDLIEASRQDVYLTARDIVLSAAHCIVGPFMRNRIVVFVPFVPGPTPESDVEAIKGAVRLIHSRMGAKLSLRVKIGLSRVESDLTRSLSAYNDSLKALISTDGDSGVVHCADCEESLSSSDSYPADLERRLLDRAIAGDVQSVHGIFAGLCQWIRARFPDDDGVLRYKLMDLLSIIRFQTREIQNQFGGFAVWKDTWRQVAAEQDLSSLERYVLSCVDECLTVVNEHKQSRMSPIIVRACAIIHESLAEDISLEEISRRVEISPFYFSKLFKEETGENFIDYLTMARMQKAKDLLREPSRSIKEISAASGYADPNYFSKLFKKVVGVTPTEFRESL